MQVTTAQTLINAQVIKYLKCSATDERNEYLKLTNVITNCKELVELSEAATVVNRYDVPATYDDCIDGYGADCSGAMIYWHNPRTDAVMLRCDHHAFIADNRHYQSA